MLDFLFLISFLVLAISFLLHSAAKGEMKKDHGMRIQPTVKMLRMQRTTRQLMSVSGAGLLILFAIVSASPSREKEPGASAIKIVGEEDREISNKDTLTIDTNLVLDELEPLPEVPAGYTDRYNEVNEVIARTDALLTLIKKNMSECNGPCSDLPLEEIQTRFDAMEELITTSRNQLQKASEIVNEIALEDPAELHTQKLFELEENLQATSYSLETMQIAESWESWDEPIEYAESTRTKRLHKTALKDTILLTNEKISEEQENENDVHENSNIASGEHFTEQQLNEVSINNEITVDRTIDMTHEMIGMIYVCGKICDNYPISDIQINLSYIKKDVLQIIDSLKTMSEVMRQLENSTTPNVDQDAVKEIANQLEISKKRMTILLTKDDWSDWKEPGIFGTESINYLENLKNNLAF
ncbi:hypothetical protein [Exiguobacterium sp. s63]|uniref:hypothetical protein n=1 Tax=Exiguobacterium sp. s63 TaxID=2751274 RepID=UPI001BE54394|nr:hypothetical protein [Exiguobacterium sp. s63]